MIKGKKAFTIIEAIVSLGVMMIMMGLGMAGIIAFRNSVELQNSYADLISVIKTLQNQAKNGLAVGIDQSGYPKVPEFYILDFRPETATETGYNVIASTRGGEFFPFETNNIFPKVNNINFEFSNDCAMIGFQNSSINIVRYPYQSLITDFAEDGTCVVTLSHKSILGSTKRITFDIEKNKIIFN
jgi:type II secretory pathway pseudopilin PulG